MLLSYITRKYIRDFKNVSSFHSVLSCICYVITAGTKDSKSSKEEHIKNLQFFLNVRNESKVEKDALTTLWLISGADPENFNNGDATCAHWGLFLESPGNFSGPKSNIQIEI